jgi:hypothetical protein
MKRKLKLARESVRNLTAGEMSQIQGGKVVIIEPGTITTITRWEWGCHTQLLCTVTVCASACPTCDMSCGC